jgi:hypothetical protein
MARASKNSQKVDFDLYKSGVVADLAFSMWGAATKLQADDLGLSGVPEDKISLGQKRLLKKDKLSKIYKVRSMAWRVFKQNSFQFPFGSAGFIPYARLGAVIESMAECEKAYFQKVDEMIADYDTDRAQMLKEYDEVFDEMLKQRNGISAGERLSQKAKLLVRLNEKYPPKDQLKRRFAYEFVIFEVTSPEFKKTSGVSALSKAGKVEDLERAFKDKVSRKLDLFLEDVVAHLKGMVLEIVGKLSKRIEDGKVKLATVRSFTKFAEAFRAMDFVDLDINDAIRSLEDKLKGVTKVDLDDSAFKETLTQEINKIRAAADLVDFDRVIGRYKRNLRVVEE